jgi:hypothetical protein
MNCHTAILNKSELLEPIRASWQKKQPMRWVKVHDLGDYAYFNHAIHVNAGVGCQSCHGNIADMEEVYQTEPLSMRWCLECHRRPELHLRPLDEVTSMDWTPPRDQAEIGARLVAERGLEPPEDCSACHR